MKDFLFFKSKNIKLYLFFLYFAIITILTIILHPKSPKIPPGHERTLLHDHPTRGRKQDQSTSALRQPRFPVTQRKLH